MLNFKSLTSAAALAVSMTATPAIANTPDWDKNGDGLLSESEFSEAFAERGVFETWDTDNDGMLSDEEFNAGVYDTYDADESGDLTQSEYGVDTQLRAPRYWSDQKLANAWDIDGDGVILANEFAHGWANMGIHEDWDLNDDGLLSRDEFSTGVFYKYDENGDGFIEEPELTDIGDDMGDGGFWDI